MRATLLLFFALLFASSLMSQENAFGSGTTNGNGTSGTSEEPFPVPAYIEVIVKARIRKDHPDSPYLSELNVGSNAQGYASLLPLKKTEGIYLHTWVTYQFDASGDLLQKVTSFSEIESADCEQLDIFLCKSIELLKTGYQKEYGQQLEGYVHFVDPGHHPYFKTWEPNAGDLVKFDVFGNRMK